MSGFERSQPHCGKNCGLCDVPPESLGHGLSTDLALWIVGRSQKNGRGKRPILVEDLSDEENLQLVIDFVRRLRPSSIKLGAPTGWSNRTSHALFDLSSCMTLGNQSVLAADGQRMTSTLGKGDQDGW